jgi:N6-adenosine-specific RNA methylase IME4
LGPKPIDGWGRWRVDRLSGQSLKQVREGAGVTLVQGQDSGVQGQDSGQASDELSLAGLGVGESFGTLLADPPWRFTNRTGKVAPEHRRLSRYDTMTMDAIASLPVEDVMASRSHCYLWVPNALLREGLGVLESWGFTYKSTLIWHKVRKDGGSDGRGVGFYFRNVTEPVLFGTRGKLRTLAPGRRQVNLLATRKREHSRKPDELYPIIESCSPGPFLELFARYPQPGWTAWGNEASDGVVPKGKKYRAYGA